MLTPVPPQSNLPEPPPALAATLRKVAVVLGLGVALAGLGVTAALRPRPQARTDLGGMRAPDLALPVIRLDQGPTVQRLGAKDFAGKPLLVHFWAPSCRPCVAEFPRWQQIWQRGPAQGYGVMAMAGDDLGAVQKFLREGHYTLPVVLDATGQGFAAWRVTAMPTTVAVTRAGLVVRVVEGSIDEDGLAGLLAEARK